MSAEIKVHEEQTLFLTFLLLVFILKCYLAFSYEFNIALCLKLPWVFESNLDWLVLERIYKLQNWLGCHLGELGEHTVGSVLGRSTGLKGPLA